MRSQRDPYGKQVNTDLSSYRMDGERVLDVLRNLLGNAVKFTPEGGPSPSMQTQTRWMRAAGFRKRFGPGIPRTVWRSYSKST